MQRLKAGDARTREIAAMGGRARRTTMNLAVAERELGRLETIEDAKRRYDRIAIWAAAGLISGTAAMGMVRVTDGWREAHQLGLSFEEVEALRNAVRTLRQE